MNVYETPKIGDLIRDNSYVGRGILLGKTPDGTKAAIAYFIMGRSLKPVSIIVVLRGGDL